MPFQAKNKKPAGIRIVIAANVIRWLGASELKTARNCSNVRRMGTYSIFYICICLISV